MSTFKAQLNEKLRPNLIDGLENITLVIQSNFPIELVIETALSRINHNRIGFE
nr:hypothetical protein [Vibrio lentus]